MLENHHSATTFQLLAETGVLEPLERDDQLHVRRGIIKAILGTDMAKHNDQARGEPPMGVPPPLTPSPSLHPLRSLPHPLLLPPPPQVAALTRHASERQPLSSIETIEYFLHMADLSNCVISWEISKRWAYRVCEEAVAQTIAEKALGLPVPPQATHGTGTERGSHLT